MAAKVGQWGPDVMRYVEKTILLQTLDHLWREHLIMLDHLRQVIGLRGYGQRDPLQEYKTEAFNLFQEMSAHLREAVTAQLIGRDRPAGAGSPCCRRWKRTSRPEHRRGRNGARQRHARCAGFRRSSRDPKNPASWGKVGRNEDCPCGSGKKYKHCHGRYG